MNIIITILLGLAGLLVLLLVIGLFMRKKHYVRREVVVNAPKDKVFEFIRLLKNQDSFNKHAMAGEERQKEYKGTDGTIGFVYAWKGNKDAGEGEKEIMDIIEGKKMEAEIRFVKPFKATARIVMETEPLSDVKTKVYWSNGGTLNYPLNLFIPMMERSVSKDMDTSLSTLKEILEK